jgi:microcystin degradation protein MlrC
VSATSGSPRVGVLILKQETATFSPTTTNLTDFVRASGDDLDRMLIGTRTEYAGAAVELGKLGASVVPGPGAWALSGGPVDDRALAELVDTALVWVREARPLDAMLLILHGAMASDTEFDPEGLLIGEVRGLVGHVPVVATLDLHAVLTERMVSGADALVPFHTYPHTDHYETGTRAARVIGRLLGRDPPASRTVVVRLPMLARGDELLTDGGLLGEAIARCQALEARPDVLEAGVLIGSPHCDVPDLASNVLVTTLGGAVGPEEEALAIGRSLWSAREHFRARLWAVEEAIDLAARHPGQTVLSDGADATSSGAPGDSNHILAQLVERRIGRSALVPIVDAPAARQAHALGVGASAVFRLGGSIDRVRHEPIDVEATVTTLGDGRFDYEDGTPGSAGATAVLRTGDVTVLVTERPVWVVGRKVFLGNGVDPAEFDLVVVKSPNGYRTYYDQPGTQLLSVDAPGCTSADLPSLAYRRCRRPIWPLDPMPDDLPIDVSMASSAR